MKKILFLFLLLPVFASAQNQRFFYGNQRYSDSVGVGVTTFRGNIIAGTDNAYDIGASGATRPRTGYFGTSVLSPIFNAATGFQIAGAATSRKMLVGNGTNFIVSTETWAVPGTSGNLLRSDGANWTSATPTTVLTPYFGANTYTPTLTNTANLDASTAHVFQYSFITDPTSGLTVVTASGYVDVDPTTTLTDTQLTISVPIASAFANVQECGGAGNSTTIAGQSAGIRAVASSGNVMMQWKTTDVTSQPMYLTFTYKVTPP